MSWRWPWTVQLDRIEARTVRIHERLLRTLQEVRDMSIRMQALIADIEQQKDALANASTANTPSA